jgi:hypothetical protein
MADTLNNSQGKLLSKDAQVGEFRKLIKSYLDRQLRDWEKIVDFED